MSSHLKLIMSKCKLLIFPFKTYSFLWLEYCYFPNKLKFKPKNFFFLPVILWDYYLASYTPAFIASSGVFPTSPLLLVVLSILAYNIITWANLSSSWLISLTYWLLSFWSHLYKTSKWIFLEPISNHSDKITKQQKQPTETMELYYLVTLYHYFKRPLLNYWYHS